ncbi:unnamed protein product [Microthlaspi erraticum]|uniref:Reverse transcriptase zinc-binding domain-containing protein n=1 Tax=Microthlaspi erraticum TaxID=1685480 RepID=A0A6D2IP26_9BRAS|nr:unnamed protein product [Microthlaspi erraticum]
MQTWSPRQNVSCILCQDPLETRDHLFFSCRYSAEIWSALSKGLLGLRYTTIWADLVTIISDKSQDRIRLFLARYVFQATLHSIWRERNARRHGEQPTPPNQLINTIDKTVRNRIQTIRNTRDHKYEEALQTWFGTRC